MKLPRGSLTRSSWELPLYYFFSVALLLVLSLVLASCAQPGNADLEAEWSEEGDLRLSTRKNELVVATYNVLNLFNTKYDVGKEDYTFLPSGTVLPSGKKKEEHCKAIKNPYYRKQCIETNWTDTHLAVKLGQIKKGVQAIGELPDLLGVQEIENEDVTKQLSQVLGYGSKYEVTDSPDERGIDVALFYSESKLEKLGKKYELVVPEGLLSSPTRNVLRVEFNVKEEPGIVLGVYVAHWPSQSSPSEERVSVAKLVRKDIDKRVRKYGSSYHVILMGDFNTLTRETPNAFHNVIEDPAWKNKLFDAQELFKNKYKVFSQKMPPNSYWYGPATVWEKLDRILFSQNFQDKSAMEYVVKSFRIVSPPSMMTQYEVSNKNSFFFGSTFFPVTKRYNFASLDERDAGYSDHLPVAVKVKF